MKKHEILEAQESENNLMTWGTYKIKYPSGDILGNLFRCKVKNYGVAILIINENDEIVLNQQYRDTHGKHLWEIPRGSIDEIGESSEQAAKREALEETGINLKNIKQIGVISPDSGIVDNQISLFLGKTEDMVISNKIQHEGIIATVQVPMRIVKQMIAEGKITDSITLSAITIYESINI